MNLVGTALACSVEPGIEYSRGARAVVAFLRVAGGGDVDRSEDAATKFILLSVRRSSVLAAQFVFIYSRVTRVARSSLQIRSAASSDFTGREQ